MVPASVPDYGWSWTEGQALAETDERIPILTEFASACGRVRDLIRRRHGDAWFTIRERNPARSRRRRYSRIFALLPHTPIEHHILDRLREWS